MIAGLWEKIETYVIVVAAMAIAGLAWGWHERIEQKRADDDAAKAELAKATAKIEALNQDNAALRQARGDHYEDIIQKLGARVDGLGAALKPIRLCDAPGGAAAPGVPGAGPAITGAAGGGGPDLRAGDDLAPALVRYAQRCETDRRHVIELVASIDELKKKWEAP